MISRTFSEIMQRFSSWWAVLVAFLSALSSVITSWKPIALVATALGGLWQAIAKLPSTPTPQAMTFAGIIPGASILTTLVSYAVGAAAVAALFWGTVAYLEHKGKEKLRAEQAAAVAKFNAKERQIASSEREQREAWEAERRADAERIAINRGLAIGKDGREYIPDDVVDQINKIRPRAR